MEFSNLLFEKDGPVAVLTVNRPKALNALNSDTLQDLDKAIDLAAADDEVKVVIITGAGNAFVAGADIVAMQSQTAVEGKVFGALGQGVFLKLEKMLKPVIAAINGFALGGGCELAMACDIRLASEKAKFGQPEVGLGIIPGFAGTQRN
jgi:enoyl-CoA hydratase